MILHIQDVPIIQTVIIYDFASFISRQELRYIYLPLQIFNNIPTLLMGIVCSHSEVVESNTSIPLSLNEITYGCE